MTRGRRSKIKDGRKKTLISNRGLKSRVNANYPMRQVLTLKTDEVKFIDCAARNIQRIKAI
jgi:hypothetical protein